MKPHLRITIDTLLKGGATHREIERRTGVDRKTISRYARGANSPGVTTGRNSQFRHAVRKRGVAWSLRTQSLVGLVLRRHVGRIAGLNNQILRQVIPGGHDRFCRPRVSA